MQYRLIVTDIDGTLLNQHGEVTPRVRSVLGELERRGATVVLATARPPRRVREIHAELGLSGPIICYNGAMAFEPKTGRTLFSHGIAKDVAQRVIAAIRAEAPSLILGLELEDEWHVDRLDPELLALQKRGLLLDVPHCGPVEEALAHTRRSISKLYFIAPPETRRAVQARLQGEPVCLTSSGFSFVEIHAEGVNKGSALRALAAILGVPLSQTVALGDAENDVPALQAAGLGIAMGNAPDHVKAAARMVTRSNADDGWAIALETHVLAG